MLLRSLPRAVPGSSSSTLRSSSIRTSPLKVPITPAASSCIADIRSQQTRTVAQHAISNPTLADIEKRWERMPPQEQADLWMALRDRMKNDWHELTVQERKAAYWIAFGPHGPRALPPPDETFKIVRATLIGVGISFVIFLAIRSQARPPPKTMNAQYQEMTNEYLKVQPITGISSEGYSGKGMVQSKPRKGGIPSDDDE
ncbi:MAG: Cytochrome c oxidase subunit 5B, mitochondrial [Ramalina farinacea]|uniref:Cytochrome c oxidase polypeptide V n=1 Tax=Ramalina farinacea TaxID=258253 RepID=A0AA43TVC9_9LECA|nr:Cytochrome c oxidase subunit 5B, mitochondrial [Ramalina farinacea]